MLCTNGGNVIMMQVENEYGYYGDDKEYLKNLVALYREQGMDVPRFTSDGTKMTEIIDGSVEGCFSTLNFGSRVEESFKGIKGRFSKHTVTPSSAAIRQRRP